MEIRLKKLVTSIAAFASTLSLNGCSLEQYHQVSAAAVQARTGSAIRLATSTTVAQMALFHIAAAVSQAARRDLNDPAASPLANSSETAAGITYEADSAAGTGTVIDERDGSRLINLQFTFEGATTNAGVAYSVTSTTGTIEGYQLLFPRLTITFSTMLGNNFSPVKHANGSYLINAMISASGYLGVSGVETTRVSSSSISITYPVTERAMTIGNISTSDRDGKSFDGDVFLAQGVIGLKGRLKEPNGDLAFELQTLPSGEISLVPPTPQLTPSASADRQELN